MARKLLLTEWAAIGELIGTAAVIVSLLFVAYTINRNTLELQASNENFLYGIQEARRADEANNPQLTALVVKAQNGAALTPEEKRQYFSHIIRGLNAWELAYVRYRNGLIPAETWPIWDRMYADQARNDFPLEMWLDARKWYSDDFVAHVDRIYANH